MSEEMVAYYAARRAEQYVPQHRTIEGEDGGGVWDQGVSLHKPRHRKN